MKNPDILQRFLFDGTDVRGEITTLSSSYQDIIALHDYPQTISKLFEVSISVDRCCQSSFACSKF